MPRYKLDGEWADVSGWGTGEGPIYVDANDPDAAMRIANVYFVSVSTIQEVPYDEGRDILWRLGRWWKGS